MESQSLEEKNNKVDQALFPRIRIGDYRFVFTAEKSLPETYYEGSAWRGAFGHALKRTVCVIRKTRCEDCPLFTSCCYARIFETPSPPGTMKMRKYNSVPHPFVICPLANTKNKGGEYTLQVRLFGNTIQDLAYVVYAMSQAGSNGVANTRFELKRVEQYPASTVKEPQVIFSNQEGNPLQPLPGFETHIPELPKKIRIRFYTPFRVKKDGKLVSPEAFTFHNLFSPLLRRHSMLMYFHEEMELDVPFKELTTEAHHIEITQRNLRWFDWARRSSRQNSVIRMGGIVGDFVLETKKLEPYWPFLWLGQWTHVGKGTVMGLGNYNIGFIQ